MTVIRPNSVSGITSITAQASEINFFRSNGALAGLQLNGVNFNTTTGISTFNNLNVGGVLTYQDVTNVDSLGIGTFRAGIDVSGGQLDLNDNIKIRLGSSQDLEIYHDGSNSFIKDSGTGSLWLYASEFNVGSADGNEAQLKCAENGAVELYHNNEKKLFTKDNGVQVEDTTATGAYLTMATSSGTAGKLYATGNNTLGFLDSQNHYMLKGVKDGAVELYHNNSKKFETTSSGFKSQGSGQVNLLLGSTDGGGTYLILDGDANGDANGSDYAYLAMTNQGVLDLMNMRNEDLRFGNNNTIRARFTTSGHFVPQSDNTYDLGSSGARWQNVYTTDLQLSNKGSTNSVDNTWGDYTIQEGESDLFLINNRSGKKYKFNLTEVS